ncbi:MAG: precorrin-4 C(11)-methyltransferase [Clostridiales bacterium]|jgi:precorrin-4/cobalt-precorrin-4 C11-methyltransferase|nr:precorrin-4 C(11)-methyltransferase [Clostridiales bacterium]
MSKVYFVGAGPGATDLITLRGKSLLELADVIIYAGSLVNPDLLKFARESCAFYNSAYMTIDEVIDVISKAVSEDLTVIRLHTGDPSVYGAIREQMDRLIELNIDYEICPGVSSFSAAAAALKAEYTLPKVSQTVILTRAAGRTDVPYKESISALSSHRATMIFFLSAGLLEKVTAELLSGGYPPDTPAAIVYKASWPDEKVFRTTVSGLAACAKENNIAKTALICVGDFLGSDYELSRLYANDFSTEYREGNKEGK